MTLIHLRDVRLCPAHHSAIVRMDDSSGALTMTFAADSHEAVRLGRVVRHGPQACHPIFDFVRALLCSLEAGVTRVVLEDVQGEGISRVVYVGTGRPKCRCRAIRPTPSRWRSGQAFPSTPRTTRSRTPSPRRRRRPTPSASGSNACVRPTSDRPPTRPDRRDQANIEKSSAFSVMNSSSAGTPSRVLATARRMAGTMSSGSVTRSP